MAMPPTAGHDSYVCGLCAILRIFHANIGEIMTYCSYSEITNIANHLKFLIFIHCCQQSWNNFVADTALFYYQHLLSVSSQNW